MDPDLSATLQPYAYAGDNPTDNDDPFGEFECAPLSQCEAYVDSNYDNSLNNGFNIYEYFAANPVAGVALTANEVAGIVGASVEEANGSPSCVGNDITCIKASNYNPDYKDDVASGFAFGIAAWTSQESNGDSSYGGLVALLTYAHNHPDSDTRSACSTAPTDAASATDYNCWAAVETDGQVQMKFLAYELANIWHSHFVDFENDSSTPADAGYAFDYYVIAYEYPITSTVATSAEDLATVFATIRYA